MTDCKRSNGTPDPGADITPLSPFAAHPSCRIDAVKEMWTWLRHKADG